MVSGITGAIAVPGRFALDAAAFVLASKAGEEEEEEDEAEEEEEGAEAAATFAESIGACTTRTKASVYVARGSGWR